MAMALTDSRSPSLASDEESYGTVGDGLSPAIHELPTPQLNHHVLYFRLANGGVFRSIRVPSNYDFHLIHRLIQYTYGWSDTHLHQFEVRPDCDFYKSQPKKTWIKNWGKTTNIIANKGIGRTLSFERPGYSRDERQATVGDIWSDEASYRNGDHAVGVLYVYDFGDTWEVEITCTGLKKLKSPSDLPHILRGKGGPPKEVCKEEDNECFAYVEQKAFDVSLFNEDGTWRKYLIGDIWSKARVDDVRLFTREENDMESGQESEDDDDGEDEDDGDDNGDNGGDDDKHEFITNLESGKAEEVLQQHQAEIQPQQTASMSNKLLHGTTLNKRAAEENLTGEDSGKRTRVD